jgi:hypothetical protein
MGYYLMSTSATAIGSDWLLIGLYIKISDTQGVHIQYTGMLVKYTPFCNFEE